MTHPRGSISSEWTSEGRKKGLSRKHPQPTSLKGPCSPPRSGDHDGFGGAGVPMNSCRGLSGEPHFQKHPLHKQAGRWNSVFGHERCSCPRASAPASWGGPLSTPSSSGRLGHWSPIPHRGKRRLGRRGWDLWELQAGARATKATTTALGPERREAPAHPPLQAGRAQPAGIYVRSVGLRLRLDN